MIDLRDSIYAPATDSPDSFIDYLVNDTLNYMATDEFLIEVSDKIEIPSKAKITINELKVKRMTGQRRKEFERYIELQKLIAKVKEFLEDARKGGLVNSESTDTAIPNVQTFSSGIGRVSEIYRGLENYKELGERNNIQKVTNIEEILNNINKSIERRKLISFSEIDILKRAMELYEGDNIELRRILKILNKEITNRTKKSHKDILSYLTKIEKSLHRRSLNQAESDKLEERIRRNLRAIILDDLDNRSNFLISEYLKGKLEYEEYLKRKQMLFSSYNSLWPE